jgi:putative iron-regulated protein
MPVKPLLAALLLATPVWAEDPDIADARLAEEAARTCFRIMLANYEDCTAASRDVEKAVEGFVAAPTAASLETARRAWIKARGIYAPSEAYRFCGGPIDAEGGPEELLNAWPIDESVIDRVPGSAVVSIIEDEKRYPVLRGEVLTSLNMKEGEKNITCGWHAVEFLLWGQDSSAAGPGDRPVSDFTTAPHAARRRQFLSAAAVQVTQHLAPLVTAWQPGARDNHRARMEGTPADDALRTVVKGMVMLAGFELASERLGVPCETRLQEDEHSCFSDTTIADIRGNVQGLVNLWEGTYKRPGGEVVHGPGIKALTTVRDAELAAEITKLFAEVTDAADALPARFDQAILENPDGPGQQALRTLAARLTALSAKLKLFAARMGRPFTAAELEG